MEGVLPSLLSAPEQAGALSDVTVNDGPEKGTRVIWVRNAVGMQCAVHPDRGMDIGQLLYRGFPVTWASLHGNPAPWAFSRGINDSWLDTFGGGLLTTCGLLFMGKPGADGDQSLGLHGNISHQPAREVAARTEESGSGFVVEGRVSESAGFFTRLDLRRRVRIPMGEAVVEVRDTVTNAGAESSPLMLLYHMNFGYPLVDPAATRITWPGAARRLWGEDGDTEFSRVLPPGGGGETVAQVDVPPGPVEVVLENRRWLGGVRLTIAFDSADFPFLFHWRMFRSGVYGIAVEPATAGLEGRAQERAMGRVRLLDPGDSQTFGMRVALAPWGGDGANG